MLAICIIYSENTEEKTACNSYRDMLDNRDKFNRNYREKHLSHTTSGEMSYTDQLSSPTGVVDTPSVSPIDTQSSDIENAMVLLKIRELKSF